MRMSVCAFFNWNIKNFWVTIRSKASAASRQQQQRRWGRSSTKNSEHEDRRKRSRDKNQNLKLPRRKSGTWSSQQILFWFFVVGARVVGCALKTSYSTQERRRKTHYQSGVCVCVQDRGAQHNTTGERGRVNGERIQRKKESFLFKHTFGFWHFITGIFNGARQVAHQFVT